VQFDFRFDHWYDGSKCPGFKEKKMPTKQVIVIRKDLNMRKGKIASQAAHASIKVFFDRMEKAPWVFPEPCYLTVVTEAMAEWINGLFTKICVYVESEEELLNLYNKAKESGIPCSLIQDAGLTEFGGVPTYTCIAVGPDYNERVDEITGGLPLL